MNHGKKEKREPSIADQWYRWKVIQEFRLPSTSNSGSGPNCDGIAKSDISPYIAKAVLLELAQWAGPNDGEVRKSVEYISYTTQIPERTVSSALRFLREHGIILRQRHLGTSSSTRINWPRIESGREPRKTSNAQVAHSRSSEPPTSEPMNVQVSEEVLPSQDAKEVVERLSQLEHVGQKLSSGDKSRLASSLLYKYPQFPLLEAIRNLSGKALEIAAQRADSPAAYLRRCIDNAIREAMVNHIKYLVNDGETNYPNNPEIWGPLVEEYWPQGYVPFLSEIIEECTDGVYCAGEICEDEGDNVWLAFKRKE